MSLPALLGGVPERQEGPPPWPIPDDHVAAAVEAALRDGSWGKYDGGHVDRLETAVANFHDVPFALTCASGTLAVELALRAIPVGPGDEVILAAYDYEPNFLSVHAVGARPVLVDVAMSNWNLDPDRLDEAVSSATKAIIVSHLHGGMPSMARIAALAAQRRLYVIEDAAQAAGAMLQGRRAGAWGDIGILSFGGSKLLTAGRGGALLTRRADLCQRLRVLLRRGGQQWAALSELQAAALLPQLMRLDERNTQRRRAVDALRAWLVDLPALTMFDNGDLDAAPAYYKLGFRLDEQAMGLSRERFVAAVRAEGIALDAGFRGSHVGRAPARYRRGSDLTHADGAHAGCVVLHHPVLLCNELARQQVARAMRKVYLNAERLAAAVYPPRPNSSGKETS